MPPLCLLYDKKPTFSNKKSRHCHYYHISISMSYTDYTKSVVEGLDSGAGSLLVCVSSVTKLALVAHKGNTTCGEHIEVHGLSVFYFICIPMQIAGNRGLSNTNKQCALRCLHLNTTVNKCRKLSGSHHCRVIQQIAATHSVKDPDMICMCLTPILMKRSVSVSLTLHAFLLLSLCCSPGLSSISKHLLNAEDIRGFNDFQTCTHTHSSVSASLSPTGYIIHLTLAQWEFRDVTVNLAITRRNVSERMRRGDMHSSQTEGQREL